MKAQDEVPKTKGTRWFGWFLVATILVMATTIVVQRYHFFKPKASDVVVLTEANFQQQTASGVVLVDVWAEWCKPCKAMEPAINALAGEWKGRAMVGKLNADDHKSLAESLGVEVLPTLIILKNGQEVDRLLGMHTQETMAAALEQAINQ